MDWSLESFLKVLAMFSRARETVSRDWVLAAAVYCNNHASVSAASLVLCVTSTERIEDVLRTYESSSVCAIEAEDLDRRLDVLGGFCVGEGADGGD